MILVELYGWLPKRLEGRMHLFVLLGKPEWLDIQHIPINIRIIVFGKELVTKSNYKEIVPKNYSKIEILYQLVKLLEYEQYKLADIYLDIPLNYQMVLKESKMISFHSISDCWLMDYLNLLHPVDKDIYDIAIDLILNNPAMQVELLPFHPDIKAKLNISFLKLYMAYKKYKGYSNTIEYYINHKMTPNCLSPVNNCYLKCFLEFVMKYSIAYAMTSHYIQDVYNSHILCKYQITLTINSLVIQSNDHFLLFSHALESICQVACQILVNLLIHNKLGVEFNNEREKSMAIHYLSPFDDYFQLFNHKMGYLCCKSSLIFESSPLVIESIEDGFVMHGESYRKGKTIDGLLLAAMRTIHKLKLSNQKNLLFEHYYNFFDYFPTDFTPIAHIQIQIFKHPKNKKLHCKFTFNKVIYHIPFLFHTKYDIKRFILFFFATDKVVSQFSKNEPYKRHCNPRILDNPFNRYGKNYCNIKYDYEMLFGKNKSDFEKYNHLFEE